MTSIAAKQVNTLYAQDLACVRGDRQLFSELTFSLVSGQCLHVIGANGSGKTSLLRILCGLRLADDGHVSWNDDTVHGNRRFKSEAAYIGHKDGLKNELTAIENLRIYQRLMTKHDETALDDCLHAMGILHCADLYVQQLSFGQRRRLAFARLLLGHKPLWILDEPFTGIDTLGRRLIEAQCIQHLDQGGSIVLTHHQSLAASPLNPYRVELSLDPA